MCLLVLKGSLTFDLILIKANMKYCLMVEYDSHFKSKCDGGLWALCFMLVDLLPCGLFYKCLLLFWLPGSPMPLSHVVLVVELY